MQLQFRLYKICVLAVLVVTTNVFSMEHINDAVSKLVCATLGTMIGADRDNAQRLKEKDYNDTKSLDFLSETNYCAGAIVDLNGDTKYVTYNSIDPSLQNMTHSRSCDVNGVNVAVFCSGGRDKTLESFLKAEFESYHSRVFGAPFPSLYPTREVHFRKSDSEQKLLHAMNSFYAPTPNTQLLYSGRILVIYSVRNTCQFCNVALGGFIAEQISRVANRQPSLFIKGIHVFYSFDDGNLVKPESDRVKVSPFLVQPYITYTQLTTLQTVKYMIKNVLSDTPYDKELSKQLIKGISLENLGELSRQLISELPLEQVKELFCRLFYEISLEKVREFVKQLLTQMPSSEDNNFFDWLRERDGNQLSVFFNMASNADYVIALINDSHLVLSQNSISYLLDELSEMYENRIQIDKTTPYIKILSTLPNKINASIENHASWQIRSKKNLLRRLLDKRVRDQ